MVSQYMQIISLLAKPSAIFINFFKKYLNRSYKQLLLFLNDAHHDCPYPRKAGNAA